MRLEIKNLSKTYPNGVRALNRVNLSIGTGMFGLLGQNGAGKSTLMRTIATLQDADEGSITFGDIDVAERPDELRRALGYLPQEFGLYPSATAEEMLLYLADLKGIGGRAERRAQVDMLLRKVNLHDTKHQRLGTYSGGMKQRFGIAQALLGNPKIIIVDEPTAGLDPSERNRFYNLLSEIGSSITVILSTHIVEDVYTLCNDMAIVGNGQVLLSDAPRKVEERLHGRCWVKAIEKSELQRHQAEFNVISSHFCLGQMNITVVSDKTPGDDFTAREPTLEDAYFHTLARHEAAVNGN